MQFWMRLCSILQETRELILIELIYLFYTCLRRLWITQNYHNFFCKCYGDGLMKKRKVMVGTVGGQGKGYTLGVNLYGGLIKLFHFLSYWYFC